MTSEGGYQRRSTDGLEVVSRKYIRELIDKVDQTDYSSGYEYLRTRDKALVALLYLSGRRVSEVVGRTYRYTRGSYAGQEDSYEGVTLGNIWEGHIRGKKVLKFRCRILKKGSWKKGLKKKYAVINIRYDDPLVPHIVRWVDYQKNIRHREDYEPLFDIKRSRAYQIINGLDHEVWPHWLRHQRLSHLSETMGVYDLRSWARWESIEPAVDYVHSAVGELLEKTREADRLAGIDEATQGE